MKIVDLSLRTVFAQHEHREKPLTGTKTYQRLDYYEGRLEVEALHTHFLAIQQMPTKQAMTTVEIGIMYRRLRHDITDQIEGYILNRRLIKVTVTPGEYRDSFRGTLEIDGEIFQVLNSTDQGVPEQIIVRQIEKQTLRAVCTKIFEGWEI